MSKLDRDPGNPRHRELTRATQRQVRALLMEWDAIGVSWAPQAADEYDCMISPILHRLSQGVGAEELATWIRAERDEHFGLAPNPDRDMQLALRLTAWWAEQPTTQYP